MPSPGMRQMVGIEYSLMLVTAGGPEGAARPRPLEGITRRRGPLALLGWRETCQERKRDQLERASRARGAGRPAAVPRAVARLRLPAPQAPAAPPGVRLPRERPRRVRRRQAALRRRDRKSTRLNSSHVRI